MTFGGEDLYPSLVDKAATLGFSLIRNHPFVDGNKRIGHAVMEAFLVLNGYEIQAPSTNRKASSSASPPVNWTVPPLRPGYVHELQVTPHRASEASNRLSKPASICSVSRLPLPLARQEVLS
jgi:hypothetical protein